MYKFIIFALVLLLNTQSALAQKVVFSSSLSIDVPAPEVIAHSGEVLIFKYADSYFSHELIDPKTLYGVVDLTGIEHSFIKQIFGVENTHKLPEWLNELAKEQATVFGVTKKNTVVNNISNNLILSNFLESEQEGNIFFLEEYAIHRIYFSGNKEAFTILLNKLKDNKDGS